MLADVRHFLPKHLASIVREYTGAPRWVRVRSYRPQYNENLKMWMRRKRSVYTWRKIL